MTQGSRDDFAEIRMILTQTAQRLDRVAESQERTQVQQAENTVAIAELRQSQSENLVAIAELRRGIAETRQITDSNARSLEAMQSRIDGSFDLHERMMQIALEDRQQWREQRQRFIERNAELADEQEDTRQSIQNLLEDARADRQARERERQANEQEHQAFRESFQILLTEIARIWQRLAS